MTTERTHLDTIRRAVAAALEAGAPAEAVLVAVADQVGYVWGLDADGFRAHRPLEPVR